MRMNERTTIPPSATGGEGPTTVILAGVHKAGTTSLFEYLSAHPGISPARIKELRWFTRMARDGVTPDLAEYDRLFHYRENARYRLEASPAYVCSRFPVAELVKSCLPDARILVLLREPVERLLSLYNRAVAHSDLPPDFSFREYVEASLAWRPGDSDHYVYTQGLRDGFYIEHLRPWHRLFGENLKILFTDDLKADGRALTAKVCRWLGLDPSLLADEPFEVSNRTLHYRFRRVHRTVTRFYMHTEAFWRRHPGIKRAIRRIYNRALGARAAPPEVEPETLALLQDLYAPYNEELRKFLVEQHIPLPPWLQSLPASRRESPTRVEIARHGVRRLRT
jgi:hypothetical protein